MVLLWVKNCADLHPGFPPKLLRMFIPLKDGRSFDGVEAPVLFRKRNYSFVKKSSHFCWTIFPFYYHDFVGCIFISPCYWLNTPLGWYLNLSGWISLCFSFVMVYEQKRTKIIESYISTVKYGWVPLNPQLFWSNPIKSPCFSVKSHQIPSFFIIFPGEMQIQTPFFIVNIPIFPHLCIDLRANRAPLSSDAKDRWVPSVVRARGGRWPWVGPMGWWSPL